MNAPHKPLRMADLPGKIYRCPDEHPVHKIQEARTNTLTHKLSMLPVGETIDIPKTSAGLVTRVQARNGIKLTYKTLEDGETLRVLRTL